MDNIIDNRKKCNFSNIIGDYNTEIISKYKARNFDKLYSKINEIQSIEELKNLKEKITKIQCQLNKNKLNHGFVYLSLNYDDRSCDDTDKQIIILCVHQNSFSNKKVNWFGYTNFTAHAQKLIDRIDEILKLHSKLSINPIKTIKDFAFNDSIKYDEHQTGFENEYNEFLYCEDYLTQISYYLKNKASPNDVKKIASYISKYLHDLPKLSNNSTNKLNNYPFSRLLKLWGIIFKYPEIYEKLLVKYDTLSDNIRKEYPADHISSEKFKNDDEVFVLHTLDSKNNEILNSIFKKDCFLEYITTRNNTLKNSPNIVALDGPYRNIIIFKNN